MITQPPHHLHKLPVERSSQRSSRHWSVGKSIRQRITDSTLSVQTSLTGYWTGRIKYRSLATHLNHRMPFIQIDRPIPARLLYSREASQNSASHQFPIPKCVKIPRCSWNAAIPPTVLLSALGRKQHLSK